MCRYSAIAIVQSFGISKRKYLKDNTVTARTVPHMPRIVIFKHYVTIARRYNRGVHHYRDVAVASWVLTMDTTSL